MCFTCFTMVLLECTAFVGHALHAFVQTFIILICLQFFFFQWLIAFSQWTHLLLFLACLKCLYSFVTIPSSLCFISLLCNFMMCCLWLQAIGQNHTTCTSLLCTPWMLILTCTPFTLKSLKLLIMEVKSQSYFNPLSLLKEMFRPDCKKVATQGCERLAAAAPD